MVGLHCRAVAHATLQRLFRETLDLPDGVNVEALAFGHHEHWDSVGHMALVAAIEDEYGVMFDTDDVVGMSSFAVAVETVRRLGAEP